MPGFNGPSEVLTVNGNLQINDDGTGNYGKMIGGPLAGPVPQLVATTPAAGVALVNGTPTILTWTAPNDGKNHRVTVFGTASITSAMTGGQVNGGFFAPSGANLGFTLVPVGAGPNGFAFSYPVVIQSGTTFSISQVSPLTAGACQCWFEIWAS